MIPDPKGPYIGAQRQRLFGVYTALVVELGAGDRNAQVRVKLPWVDEDEGGDSPIWARVSTMMAGADRGTWFIPEIDDEVLIAFVAGDPRHPIVVGALWNGVDEAPENMDSGGDNPIRSITTESGHKLSFDDRGRIDLESAGGHKVTLDDTGTKILIEHSIGSSIEMSSDGSIKISAINKVEIEAPAGTDITTAKLTVNAPLSTFSGVVQCQVLQTPSVIAATYTPGAGNVW